MALMSGQSPADLLLIHNGGDRRTEQDNSADTIHMDAFVQGINAVQQAQMGIVLIRLEIQKGLARGRIRRVHGEELGGAIHLSKPFGSFPHHFLHMLVICAENDILPRSVSHVLGKNILQSIRLFQRAAKRIQIPFGLIPNSFIPDRADTLTAIFQVLLIGKYRNNVLGGG